MTLKNKMDSVETSKMEKETTFWAMWINDLPGSFPKKEVIDALSRRWDITQANVYGRLKNENFMYLQKDLLFLFENYGIAFDYRGKGFFLDQKQYELIQQNSEMEAANLFGLRA